MNDRLFQTTFSRVFIGITLTATIALAIAQIISYYQLKSSFEQFATQQVTVFRQIGRDLLIKEDIVMPADYDTFIQDYKNEMARHVIFSFSIGLLLSLVAGVIISTQITQPISRLKRTMKNVTSSKYQIRAPEKGSKEVKELISQFNRLIEELEQQEELRQELLANISHELKTPLTKIKGQIEGLLDGVYQDVPATLNKVLANLNQLEYLIEKLYEVNQLAPQDVSLNLKKCQVRQIVEESISGFTKKPIIFKVDIDKKLKINADENRLKQIIDNLVTNAYKFTSRGTITIKADKHQFSISDTGIGIDKRDINHIFERLYRVEKSRSRETGGLGLGLYIVKILVDLHGWQIIVKSKKGHGSTFIIDWSNPST